MQNCARCSRQLTESQQRRGNRYCGRRCARLADWDRNGGRRERMESGGSVYIKRGDGKWVLEHRLVMEQHLGRALSREERVVHRNDDTMDNRLENLQLQVRKREVVHCPGCRCFEPPKVSYA